MQKMAYKLLTVQKEDRFALVTLNRPEKSNAVSITLANEMADCLNELENDDDVSVVIITGNGRCFSGGFDTKEAANREPEHVARFKLAGIRWRVAVLHFTKPVIAAVNGPAVGLGCTLAFAADVRIASETASFGFPEIKLGVPVVPTLWKEMVGAGLSAGLTLSGKLVDAQEAYRFGIVNKLVSSERLIEEAKEFARVIAEAPRETLQTVKRWIIAESEARHAHERMLGTDLFGGIKFDAR